jgi:DNA polymerase-3 subunit delta'
MLNSLSQDEIAATIGSLGKPWSELSKDDVSLACQHADGSIREALRLLDSEAIQFHDQIIGILHRLPQIDWMGVHQLAEKVTGRDQEAAYEALIRAVETYLDERVRTRAKDLASAPHLIAYAQAWQEIHKLAQEAEVFNFDKKALTLGIFERLAKAEAQ